MFYKYLQLALLFAILLPQASAEVFDSHNGLDKTAYNAYQRTQAFQVQSRMAKTELHTDMYATNKPTWNTIEWGVTLKSLKEQTAERAYLAALAKGYHTDFIYMILSIALYDKNKKEVYRTPTIKRKMYTDKRSYIHHSSEYPKGLQFNSSTIIFNIDLEEATYANQLNKARKAKVQAIRQKRKTKVQTIRQKRNTLLSKVDHISNSAYLQDDVLNVNFFYTNRSIDKQLYWKNDVATITCNAYGNSGSWSRPSKGSLIGQISNKRVTRAFQNIYIDIRKTAFKRGILECSINIHERIFKISDTFLIK